MHGEYKMPGGKLIVADIDVVDGQLATVHISGDFFLEPDTALNTINRALVGLPITIDAQAMTHAIDTALGDGVVMYGISSAAVTVAVTRALEPQA